MYPFSTDRSNSRSSFARFDADGVLEASVLVGEIVTGDVRDCWIDVPLSSN